MNKQIDVKSVVIGILITVCIVLAMGAERSSMPTMFGRFQVAAGDDNAYIIDTTNGQAWERKGPGNDLWKIFRAPKIQQESAADNQTK